METSERTKKSLSLRRPVDLYTPRCDEHRFYTPLQCLPTIGYYCVDKYGKCISQSSHDMFRQNCEKFGPIALTRHGTKSLPTRTLTTQARQTLIIATQEFSPLLQNFFIV